MFYELSEGWKFWVAIAATVAIGTVIGGVRAINEYLNDEGTS